MSSAKTIADILAFAELIDPKSFIGNPFTSQPMYIAACAFLVESASTGDRAAVARDDNAGWQGRQGRWRGDVEQRCQGHQAFPSGFGRQPKLPALLQIARAIASVLGRCQVHSSRPRLQVAGQLDCETFSVEEYNNVIRARRGSLGRLGRLENPASPSIPPIAWSLTGTTNSPSSNLTLLYQNSQAAATSSWVPRPRRRRAAAPPSCPHAPGNMIYDPIRQSDTAPCSPGVPTTHRVGGAAPSASSSPDVIRPWPRRRHAQVRHVVVRRPEPINASGV